MARAPRLNFPDAVYHVTSRGNGRAMELDTIRTRSHNGIIGTGRQREERKLRELSLPQRGPAIDSRQKVALCTVAG